MHRYTALSCPPTHLLLPLVPHLLLNCGSCLAAASAATVKGILWQEPCNLTDATAASSLAPAAALPL
jgi:hypothetical protein